jgi:hypothetical protein
MKVYSKLALASGLLLMHASCQKETATNSSALPGSEVESFDQMEVSNQFDWTSGVKQISRVTVEPVFWMDLEGKGLQIINKKGKVAVGADKKNSLALHLSTRGGLEIAKNSFYLLYDARILHL